MQKMSIFTVYIKVNTVVKLHIQHRMNFIYMNRIFLKIANFSHNSNDLNKKYNI